VTAPEGAARRRTRIRPRTVLLAVAGAVALAGCGASAATPPAKNTGHGSNTGHGTRPPTTGLVVVTVPDMIGHAVPKTFTVKEGTNVEFMLASHSYRRNHTIAPWGSPQSSDPAVLALVLAPGNMAPCGVNHDAICTVFKAKAAGTATVTAGGPSGFLCSSTSTHCVAVMSILGRVTVKVTA
jgi:hypothetical protein